MKTVCIVQARRRSERLPDKVLADLGGEPAIAHTLKRCQMIRNVDEVVLAGIDDPFEDPVADIARALGVTVVRGSSHDLVARYELAANESGADIVMRVTGDCPLLDPAVCAHIVDERIRLDLDYATAVGWPHGLDCEVFTKTLLDRIAANTSAAPDREHVTLWVAGAADVRKQAIYPDAETLAQHPDMQMTYRWVLDYPEDYEFLKAIFAYPEVAKAEAGWEDVVGILQKNPEIQAINSDLAHHWHKTKDTLVKESMARNRKDAAGPK